MKRSKSNLYSFTACVMLSIYSIFVNTKIEGEHFLPKTGSIILVSNHISFLDPIALGYLANRRKRQISFLAKDSLFKNKIVGYYLRRCQQIPVSRGTDKAKDSLFHAEKALRLEKCIGVYPEATISTTKELLPIKSGVIRLAQLSGAEVIVVGTSGAQNIWTKGSKPKFKIRTKHYMVVSRGFKIPENKDIDEAREELQILMDKLAKEAQRKLER